MKPLEGISVLELGGIGPAPFACMLLSDLGARIIRIERPGGNPLEVPNDPTLRGRETLQLNLKADDAMSILEQIVAQVDVLIEGYRPGVLERIGLDIESLTARYPRLIVGRMTGWGQTGPRAPTAGHDLNYMSLSGLLDAMGDADRCPTPPLNLVADYGGGALFLVIKVMAALMNRTQTGHGGILDVAMCDGVATLGSVFYAMQAHGLWQEKTRNQNLLDGGAPFYRTYRTSDDRFIAVGCIEPKFYSEFLRGLKLSESDLPMQYDRGQWSNLAQMFQEVIQEKTMTEWCEIFEGSDACVTPVLRLSEAPNDPHHIARETFLNEAGKVRPRALSSGDETQSNLQGAQATLASFGFTTQQIDAFVTAKTIRA